MSREISEFSVLIDERFDLDEKPYKSLLKFLVRLFGK